MHTKQERVGLPVRRFYRVSIIFTKKVLNIFEKQSCLYDCRSIQSKKEFDFSYVGVIGDQFFYKESSGYF